VGEAQEGALILDPSVDYTFGEDLRFSLQVQNASGLEHLTLAFRPELSPHIYEVDVPFQPGETISVTQTVDVNSINLHPFSELTYSWKYETANGTQRLPEQTVIYEDDSYNWQKMSRDDNTAHWIEEPPPFGLRVLDIVDESLLDLEEAIPLEEVSPVDVYVYPTMAELRQALPQNNLEDYQTGWLDLGVILVATANSQTAENELPQSIPYALAKIFLYRAAGNKYDSLPWWFREGIAGSIHEDNNPQHEQVLADAIQNKTTIPFRDLCYQSQGTGAQQDLAAYQSASFVRFLTERRSTDTIHKLLIAYLNGSDCEQGVEQVLKTSLDNLEQDWLNNMKQQAPLVRFINSLAIWIVMLLAGTLLIIYLIYATRKRGNL
jgi:hypothetical protein